MNKKYRVLLVEDHVLLREGIKTLLSFESDLEVIGEAGNGLEALRQVDKLQPDLVLMDLSMPLMGGIEAIKEIRSKWKDLKIVALTVNETEEYISATLKAGANGYVLKDTTKDELMRAIREVLAGKRVLSPGASDKIIAGYLEGQKGKNVMTAWDTLTLREREVLKLIGEGHRNKAIADLLCISPNTVEKHRSNIMVKLDLHSSSNLTSYAIEKGLVVR